MALKLIILGLLEAKYSHVLDTLTQQLQLVLGLVHNETNN